MKHTGWSIVVLALFVALALAGGPVFAATNCTANCPGGSCTASGFGATCGCSNGNPVCTNGLDLKLQEFADAQGIAIQPDKTVVSANDFGVTALAPIAGFENLRPEHLVDGEVIGAAYFQPADPAASTVPEGFYLLQVTDDGSGTPRSTLIDENGQPAAGGDAMLEFIPEQQDELEVSARLGFGIRIGFGLHGDCWWIEVEIRVGFSFGISEGPEMSQLPVPDGGARDLVPDLGLVEF